MYDNNLQANVLMTEIVKKRVNKGIRCYEIKWNNYERTTTEPQKSVQLRYPKEVSIYEERFSNKAKKSTFFHFICLINTHNLMCFFRDNS